MSKFSSNQRTLQELAKLGCHCGVVERFNRFVDPHGVRQDLFGIIDLVALYPDSICGIQCCGSDFAAHDRKILDSPMSLEWLKSGGRLELWGWRKVKKKKGGKLMVWKPRIKVYSLFDFRN